MALSKEYQNCDINRVKELCSKFPAEFADLLELLTPIVVDYFGKENEGIILQTLDKLTIETTDQKNGIKLNDIIEKYKPSNYSLEGKSMVGSNLINASMGVYKAWPTIKENDEKYSVEDEKNIIGVKPLKYDFDGISTFLHEFLHAVKSSNDQFSIIDDPNGEQYLRERCGLNYTLYNLSTEKDGTTKATLAKEINNGMDEGINAIDEYAIMNQLLGIPLNQLPDNCRYIVEKVPENERRPNHEIKAGYRYLATASEILLKNPKLSKAIREAQLKGRYMSLQNTFNKMLGEPQNNWQMLTHNMDMVAEKMYNYYENIFNYSPEDIEAFKKDLNLNKDVIATIVNKAKNTMEKDDKKKEHEEI